MLNMIGSDEKRSQESFDVPMPGETKPSVAVSAKDVQVTERALKRIRAVIANESISPEQGGLRLGVIGGGCSGLSYSIKFESAPRDRDRIYEFDGVRIFIDPKSFVYLHGMTLDYEETLIRQGFKFINPNSAKTCGCGTSFTP
jgi:iron-sulfur cluster assembly protein